MLTLIYRAMVLGFCILLVREILRERKFTLQLTAALVLVPMALRLLMIK